MPALPRPERRYSRAGATAVGLVVGYLADRGFADPRRWHPVAGFGRAAGALESRYHRDSRWAGAGYVAVTAGTATMLAVGVDRLRMGWMLRVATTAVTTWAVLGGTSLCRVGEQMADALDSDDIAAARALVPSLCARDPNSLDADGICRAAVESIAENTSDATVGPLIWGGLAGLGGLVGYRALNTLDAMVGYRSPRHLRFGWAAARADDAVNLLPARVAGLATVAVGGAPRETIAIWRRDAAAHPSPNAGVVESSFAGALGVRLGGRTVYRYAVEERPTLGDGLPPSTADLRAAVDLSRRVQTASLVTATGVLAARTWWLSRRSAR
ncbi:cobalamin biosynthesis protein [Gordonia sp. ABSL1-1]|uniref:cobalamin biosynthesis protein n=1 Tax=Gordonia sp. ABSL1-1 TaxID=3053923 RepID=UPI002572D21B|nr:cobalamin biosynthesis protein [Gordonia sp. ABSL1-1]MDL9937321.1 cobalamin biosynthesis protein [Gordonia sp. ABSL1-1]